MPIQRELLIFAAMPAAYSIGFFNWCYFRERMPVFSRRNVRSFSTVISGHLAVLLFLILLTRMVVQFYPSFPSWLTNPLFSSWRGTTSIFGVLCVAAVSLIGWAEKRWIYVDSGAEASDSKNGPS